MRYARQPFLLAIQFLPHLLSTVCSLIGPVLDAGDCGISQKEIEDSLSPGDAHEPV